MTRPRNQEKKGLTEVRKTILSPDDPQEQGCTGSSRMGSGSSAETPAKPKRQPQARKKQGTYMEERERISRYAG